MKRPRMTGPQLTAFAAALGVLLIAAVVAVGLRRHDPAPAPAPVTVVEPAPEAPAPKAEPKRARKTTPRRAARPATPERRALDEPVPRTDTLSN